MIDKEYRAVYTRSVQTKDKGREPIEQQILEALNQEGEIKIDTLHLQLHTPKFLTMAAVWSLITKCGVTATSFDYLAKKEN